MFWQLSAVCRPAILLDSFISYPSHIAFACPACLNATEPGADGPGSAFFVAVFLGAASTGQPAGYGRLTDRYRGDLSAFIPAGQRGATPYGASFARSHQCAAPWQASTPLWSTF
ncbi:hypothetical protein B0G75_12097 [Paraburkholderia sp. BL18I3N2]|nr:hypothetical protein B0G75_12097 [Paraburkholderia sp. BL18I3N2]PRX95363.1 hypothetical protein B0G73_13356 [Paraburkholderia sp. BL25I1N1]